MLVAPCPSPLDVGEIGGIHYIGMAYIAGKPLSGLVNIDTPLPSRTAVSLMRTITLALKFSGMDRQQKVATEYECSEEVSQKGLRISSLVA